MSEHERKNMKIDANDLMDAIIEMAGDNGIAITIHPYMGNQSDTLGDEECTGNSRLSIKGPRYGLYLPGRGFHIRNCRACAEYFPTVLDYCCEKYGIIEYDAGEGLVVQFHQSQTFALDEDFYIFGPVLFYMTDHEGDYTEFAENEIAGIKQMIEENTVMYSTYQVKIPALKMGRLSDIYPDYE